MDKTKLAELLSSLQSSQTNNNQSGLNLASLASSLCTEDNLSKFASVFAEKPNVSPKQEMFTDGFMRFLVWLDIFFDNAYSGGKYKNHIIDSFKVFKNTEYLYDYFKDLKK